MRAEKCPAVLSPLYVVLRPALIEFVRALARFDRSESAQLVKVENYAALVELRGTRAQVADLM
ncbi:MAG TPA: hypothetical protein VIK01_13535, partial [Polyangiaceae bacterium]